MNRILIITLTILIPSHALFAGSNPFFYINADSVNLRSEGDINSNVVKVLNKNEVIKIIERSADYSELPTKDVGYWFRVTAPGSITGWVFSKYVSYNFGSGVNNYIFTVTPTGSGDKDQLRSVLLTSIIDGSMRRYETSSADSFDINGRLRDINSFKNVPMKFRIINDVGSAIFTTTVNKSNYYKCMLKIRNQDKFMLNRAYISVLGDYKAGSFHVIPAETTGKFTKDLLLFANKYAHSKRDLYQPSSEIDKINFKTGNRLSYITGISLADKYLFSTLISPNEYTSRSIFMIDYINNGLDNKFTRFNYLSGDATETEYYIGVTDLNNDSIPEIWTFVAGWEWTYYRCYLLEKKFVFQLYEGGRSDLIPSYDDQFYE